MRSFAIVIFSLIALIPTMSLAEIGVTNLKEKRMEFEGEEKLTFRADKDVAKRALALLAMIGLVHDQDANRIKSWVHKNGIDEYLSDEEREAILKESLSQDDKAKFSWRAEAVVSLLWCLEVIEKYPPLNEQYDLYSNPRVVEIIKNPSALLSSAKLRSKDEIEKLESDIYHQHWRVRDAQLFGKKMPEELDPEIVYERRYGLSWAVGWGDDWDDVPTDT